MIQYALGALIVLGSVLGTSLLIVFLAAAFIAPAEFDWPDDCE